MKKLKIALLTSSILMITGVQAQTVQIGNTMSGVTASGNTLSIANGNASVQIGNVPALAQGMISATKEMMSSSGSTDTSKVNSDNLAKLDAAKNNFIKQKEDVAKTTTQTTTVSQNQNTNQESVKVGQDLNTLKVNLVTNDIAFYNKTTINQIEGKALEENPKMYNKFPEYMTKNY